MKSHAARSGRPRVADAPSVPGQQVPLEPPGGRARSAASVPTPAATRQLEPALFGLALVLTDAAALAGGVLLSYWMRFGSGWLPTPLGTPAFGAYAATLPVVVPLGIFVFHQLGLYRRRRSAQWLRDL
ncbi:MAG TPA: hypothetical protein VKU85_08000, partial [bacterium]|nr:hypothetical protein [bacterium]